MARQKRPYCSAFDNRKVHRLLSCAPTYTNSPNVDYPKQDMGQTESHATEPTDADGQVHKHLLAYLQSHNVEYRSLKHPPTLTSEDSARVRGEPLEVGAKALLLKCDQKFALFVLSAACKLDSAAACKLTGARKSRFATREELATLTGLVPGSVPPFGEPILPFALFADPSITRQPRIAFNAGLLTSSVIMRASDWLELANPVVAPLIQTQ
jgi:Ala-tRNA(Pro) deacylase